MLNDKPTVLACTCRGTMGIGAKALGAACGGETAAHELCRAEIGTFRAKLGAGPLLVACTQEAPTFRLAQEAAGDSTALSFVNIRENAGWSDEAARAAPKIAALIAAATLAAAQPPTLTLRSEGVALIYGRDERALEAAEQLKDRLDITVMLTGTADVLPPAVSEYPVVRGVVRTARGYLGAFELDIDGFALALPSSRGKLVFEPGRDGAKSRCDLILDLTGGTPLFPAHAKRDGYLRPDPGDALAVQRALLAAADLTGTFDKPRYVTLEPPLCAHSRSGKIGCTRCLDLCPTGAISPAGDHVAIDPHICAGCGSCSAVCPTEAIRWTAPDASATANKLRALLTGYRRGGGIEPPVVLLHDRSHGQTLINALARAGDGLPARVLPLAETHVLGIDSLAAAFAFGAAEVRVLVGRTSATDRDAAMRAVAALESVMRAYGLGEGRAAMLDEDDPFALGASLRAMPVRTTPAAASFLPIGGARAIAIQALEALHAAAPVQPEAVALEAAAPFGRIAVADGCTLCLACVSVCPTSALRDGADTPALRFVEDACVQCGLCRSTCPERVISLEPRFAHGAQRRAVVTLREEEPALCIACGKPFGVKSSIERVAKQLVGKHWMFGQEGVAERIWMCGDCRIVAQTRNGMDPYAGPARPIPRTADTPGD